MLTTVQLHGSLGRVFGEKWTLDVSSLGEAMRAIEFQTKKFWQYLVDKDKEGIRYSVRYDSYECQREEDLALNLQKEGMTIHVTPVIQGSEDEKSYGYLAAGVALIGLAILTYGGSGLLGISMLKSGTLFAMGVMLSLSGLSQIINGAASEDDSSDMTSKSLSGEINSVKQGNPVPLAYGEVMIGSQVIGCLVQDVDESSSSSDGNQDIQGYLSDQMQQWFN